MLFNSLTYLLFLPLAVVAYHLARGRGRLWVVLIASLVFYGFWRIEFIPLMLFSAVVDYVLARMIAASDDERRRRRLMQLSIAISLIILAVFKYLIFFTQTAASIASLVGYTPSWPELHIILPLGISFYIFATISYTVDVYRRVVPAERSLLVYLCFVTFFPHLVAGPILRAGVLIPQLVSKPAISAASLASGVKRIIQGLFLKVVLGDQLAIFVERAFEAPAAGLHGADAWTMAFLFGFQIYFDFAAYSHIAIGSALLMGIILPENFNYPYLAASPREFWKRWHISLSTWVRDYLYMPLMGARPTSEGWEAALPAEREGGSIVERKRTRALFVTWGLMGLWHGANWTFVLWGTFHAVCIWSQRSLLALLPVLKRTPPALGWIITFPLMMAGWVPFRSESLGDSLLLWSRMVDPRGFATLGLWANCYFAAAVVTAGFFAWCGLRKFARPSGAGPQLVLEAAGYAVLIAFTFVFLGIRDQFIYFQF